MREKINRCYVEKKSGFDSKALACRAELCEALGVEIEGLRLFNRYDVYGVSDSEWFNVINTVLSEPVCDIYYEDFLPAFSENTRLLCIEPLPGQFNARAESCEQCIQMLMGGERPVVKTAVIYAVNSEQLTVNNEDFERVKAYIINPLEYREINEDSLPPSILPSPTLPPSASLTPPSERGASPLPPSLREVSPAGDGGSIGSSLAMSAADLALVLEYFKSEGREPTETELCVLDTYWSDHCRHTTFNTIIEHVEIDDERVKKAYDLFLSVNNGKPVTLMNIATCAMRELRKRGELPLLEESEENNACTLRINAGNEDWLLFFKNETHNHPTEIEPFGGASTCIGGAIRDPLSGRGYVYQAMRVTGAGNPLQPLEATLEGKLPQRKLTVTAAEGFSSYGNQIGLATGFVKEFYHDGYVAKRLEAGAVVGAVPLAWVRRERPEPGDVVVILGGRTGRDGIGGATGSSKTHGLDTVSDCACEVQKGNALEERKLQRLFRNPNVTKLIKRCNDFGAGGAAVAIGELADGVEINLDLFPTKYDGLNGTELAISESQERMAVVIAPEDVAELIKYAELENIEATPAAVITENKRLVMIWRGEKIVDIDRAFLDTNGAERRAGVVVFSPSNLPPSTLPPSASLTPPSERGAGSLPPSLREVPPVGGGGSGEQRKSREVSPADDGGSCYRDKLFSLAKDLNFCSQKGLVERFDGSIGAGSVFMPFGGKYALAEEQVMAALLPAEGAETCSVMACGFDPHVTEADPFGGSVYAVVTSVAKLIAVGVALDTVYLSLQEYFPSLRDEPLRWGLPFAAMLGAFSAQMGLKIAAIGGKDSMSGSFGALDVPPTLVSFALGINKAEYMLSTGFKASSNPVYLLEMPTDCDGLPLYNELREKWLKYTELCREGKIKSARVCEKGGVWGGIMKMAFGDFIGFRGQGSLPLSPVGDTSLKEGGKELGSIIFEADEELEGYRLLGYTQAAPELNIGGEIIPLADLRAAWEEPLEKVFPVKTQPATLLPSTLPPSASLTPPSRRGANSKPPSLREVPPVGGGGSKTPFLIPNSQLLIPKAVIPVFPGTNCEYDTAAAVGRAGGSSEIISVRNLTPQMLNESIAALEKAIKAAQILIFPGGFSGGDEPDGSAKFIVSLFKNPKLTQAVHELINTRNGLILGICNGFQALVKLGLLPYGEIKEITSNSPTLTFNETVRHQAKYVRTRVVNTSSPWLCECKTDEIYVQPVSHGEGRFVASAQVLEELRANGQIAFQYVDFDGNPSMGPEHNPNGSVWAIEGITSADGRILGKMAHTERYNKYAAMNIPGNKFMPLFESGIKSVNG